MDFAFSSVFDTGFGQLFGRKDPALVSCSQQNNQRLSFDIDQKTILLPFKRQSHKMAKHTQKIRRQIADELFECVWPLCDNVPTIFTSLLTNRLITDKDSSPNSVSNIK